jgi:hypothetical protein
MKAGTARTSSRLASDWAAARRTSTSLSLSAAISGGTAMLVVSCLERPPMAASSART